jgi:hypothetical protein
MTARHLSRTLVAVLFSILLVERSAHADDEGIEAKALDLAAAEMNLDEDRLEIAEFEARYLRLTDRRYFEAKVQDKRSGRARLITLDADGKRVDRAGLRADEREARRAALGALDPRLASTLQTLRGDERLSVAVWLSGMDLADIERPDTGHRMRRQEDGRAPSPGPSASAGTDGPARERPSSATPDIRTDPRGQAVRDLVDATEAQVDARLTARSEVIKRAFLDRLSARGFTPESRGPGSAPLVYLELPRAEIEHIATWDEVDTIYPLDTYRDMMDIAKPTHKANWAEVAGYDGSGVSVAILEDSRIEFDNPFLDLGGDTLADTVRVPGDANVDQHATATGGMVASQDGTHEGIGQGIDLYSANATTYGNADLSDAMDWAVSNNLDIINNSWGGNTGNTDLNVHDRHLDYIVRAQADPVLVAAGNEANTCGSQTDRVTSPARGYNVISVGGLDDNGTTTWGDDGMYFCSSFIDPSTGVQKPEVVASGASITSTTDNPADWIANVGSGTSYATPMVSAQAALLSQADTALNAYPETIKAIIMATALHNIEGDTRLSDQDGAGGVDMYAALNLVDNGWWDWDNFQASDFPHSYSQFAYAGETVRAVITWNSNPASDYSTDPLDADLDLRVYDGNGDFVTSSTSFDNSYEIVEFVAPTTGNYEFRVSQFRFDGTSEFVGFAYWPGHRRLTPGSVDSFDTPPVTHDHYRIDAAAGWNAAGLRMPSTDDYDVSLYDGSAFADPDGHTWLEDSTLGGNAIDFVVLDANHASQKPYYLEAETFSGSGGTYDIEWATRTTVADDGSYGLYAFSGDGLLRVWDAPIDSGEEKHIYVDAATGDGDLGIALFGSDGGDSGSWYQGRSQALQVADASGSGGSEKMVFTAGSTDVYGLVVWNKGGSVNTLYRVYVDTTAPTGSVAIEGGAATTPDPQVTLDNNVTDAETGVIEMRFSNDGSSWSAWEPFSATRSWTLAGYGEQTVFAEYRNASRMMAASSDTIEVPVTTASIDISNLTQTYTGSPLSVSVTTDPAGLSYDLTYDGSPSAPTNAGSYAVAVTITEPGYEGSAADTFIIEPASATLSLSDLERQWDGTPKPVTVTSSPSGVAYEVSYDGSPTAPTAIGSYDVVASIVDANYTGPDATGTLIIRDELFRDRFEDTP